MDRVEHSSDASETANTHAAGVIAGSTPPAEDTRPYAILTGFEPFGSFANENPSWEAISTLDGLTVPFHNSTNPHLTSCVAKCCRLPVEYKAVDALVPALHTTTTTASLSTTHPPLFYLHLGASSIALPDTLYIETQAHGFGFKALDNKKECPADGLACTDGEGQILHPLMTIVDTLLSTFGSSAVSDGASASASAAGSTGDGPSSDDGGASAVTKGASASAAEGTTTSRPRKWRLARSDNAGRYLCEYTFFHSLRASLSDSPADHHRRTPVFFVHVPAVGQGKMLSTQDLREAVREIVAALAACSVAVA
ncbi:peptidase C15, pyroglutamyl peptidase I-like protein [Gonapodya prolifera JEL478]|uniref:Peptidase C15, pyroglutamyl peptidase I-like protein n=1 Tax=Gonapodya prolifera (strain JEL478) TaxID=1344416 RepID=A0A139ALB1_GONPJ|nr:peptidase C15, pyroglutamyl peptidase I-like protein [Gonapodya prolifera JEL478]|eukprot:KXS17571.1 peptidase C15, pyroglutamyl peptidase I-like protein [Gonapodya prolifera JEL478]